VRVLDLFAGRGGWSQAFADRGHDVFRVDIAERFEVELYADVLTLTPAQLPWRPDVVLASPPCEAFSVLRIGRNWTPEHQPRTEQAREALALVMATRLLLERLQPAYWAVENPRAKLRMLGAVSGWERRTVTYCQFGLPYQKPTDLWGGFPPSLVLPPPCAQGSLCHSPAPRKGKFTGGMVSEMVKFGSKSPERQALRDLVAVVPYALSLRMCLAAERDLAAREVHTPECTAEWVADPSAPCSCPQPPKLVDNFVDGSRVNQPPATPTHPSGIRALDNTQHAGPSDTGTPPRHGSGVALERPSALVINSDVADPDSIVQLTTKPVLGDVVPCRTCHGSGMARNPERGNADSQRERSRLRRHGIELEVVPTTATCPECKGTGLRPAVQADRPDPERDARRLAAAAGDLGGRPATGTKAQEGQVTLWNE